MATSIQFHLRLSGHLADRLRVAYHAHRDHCIAAGLPLPSLNTYLQRLIVAGLEVTGTVTA